MRQNTKRFSSMILALVLLVGTLMVYFDLVAPAYANLETAKGKDMSEQNLLDNMQQVVAQVQGLVTTYQGQAQGQQSVNRALPSSPDVAGAITQISGMAANDTIIIQSIGIANNAPQVQPVAPVSDTTNINAAASGAAIVKPIGNITFSISASGSYEALKSFLGHIETNTRLFDVTSVVLHPAANITGGKGGNLDFFTFTIDMTGYYQAPA